MPKKQTEDLSLPTTNLPVCSDVGDDEVQSSFPWLGFYSHKSNRAVDIANDIGGITDGQPFVCKGDEYANAAQAGVQVVDSWTYYAKMDSQGNITRLSETKDEGLKEQRLCAMLVWLDGEIVPTITTLRSAKCRLATDLAGAARKTDAKGWESGDVLKTELRKLPARLRVIGKLHVSQRTSRDGNVYTVARALTSSLDHNQAQQLATALSDAAFAERLDEMGELFRNRRDYLLKGGE